VATMSISNTGRRVFSENLIEPKILSLLFKVNSLLAEQKVESYVVGGLVRDTLLGRETADIDIAVAADALEITSKLAHAIGGKYVLIDKANRVGRVVLADEEAPSPEAQWVLDFTTFKGNIEQDLARRDFTIDAMAIEISQLGKGFSDIKLIDPLNGQDDLDQGVLRVVVGTAFKSDAARLLRAVRLATELGFSIEKKTEDLIRRSSYLITGVAGERVREELMRLLAIAGAGKSIAYLDELGLLTAVFPELTQTKGVKQPKEHFWDVFDHSLNTVAAVDYLLRQGVWEYTSEEVLTAVPWSEVLAQHFDQEVSSGSTRMSLLRLAALLHDVAKPKTKAIDDGGRMRFLGHASEGAVIATNMLERLRFSTREIKLIETMIKHHLRPGQINQQNEPPTHRAIYRYFRDTGETGIDILFLSLADHLATRGPHLNLSHWQQHVKVVEYMLSQRFKEESITSPPRLVNGHDLINIYGMRPGPRIGEILEAVREAQASGELTNRQEALSFINKLVSLPL
jgi:poly(A) polymerase